MTPPMMGRGIPRPKDPPSSDEVLIIYESELQARVDKAVQERLWDWRGITSGKSCNECGGSGWKTYGSTATWRGGVGGASMTPDVCDACWGSGDRSTPWTNLRVLRSEQHFELKRHTLEDWAKRSGIGTSTLRATIPIMVDALNALLRKRKNALDFFQQRAVEVLVNALNSLLQAPP